MLSFLLTEKEMLPNFKQMLQNLFLFCKIENNLSKRQIMHEAKILNLNYN